MAKQFYLCQWIRDNQTELERAYKATVPNGNESDLQPTDAGGDDVTTLEAKKTFLFSLIDEEWSQLRFVTCWVSRIYHAPDLHKRFPRFSKLKSPLFQ